LICTIACVSSDRTEIDPDGVDHAFDEAATKNGWLIFYSHDVATSQATTDARRRCCAMLSSGSTPRYPIVSVASAAAGWIVGLPSERTAILALSSIFDHHLGKLFPV